MIKISTRTKGRRIVIWRLTNGAVSYEVTLRLDEFGAFSELLIPAIQDRGIAFVLDKVLEDVNYIIGNGVNYFKIRNKENGKS
jgi:hypothetical protein